MAVVLAGAPWVNRNYSRLALLRRRVKDGKKALRIGDLALLAEDHVPFPAPKIRQLLAK